MAKRRPASKRKLSPWWMVVFAFVCLFVAYLSTNQRPTNTRSTDAANVEYSVQALNLANTADVETAVAGDRPATTTPISTDTPAPTSTPQTYYTTSDARARECPTTSCDMITIIVAGTALSVTGIQEGEEVSGSITWMQIAYNGRVSFVHSSLLSTTRPQRPTNTPLRPTSTPAQAQPQNASPDNCSTAVAMGLSAEQAAQWDHLDRDNDGVACYGD